MKTNKFLLTCLLAVASSFAYAQQGNDKIGFENPRLRLVPPVSKMTAGYVEIRNNSSKDMVLEAAEANEFFSRMELHSMKHIDGMMRMRKTESIRIPAGETIYLKPKGLHLMAMGIKQQLKEDEVVEIDLIISGEVYRVPFVVVAEP